MIASALRSIDRESLPRLRSAGDPLAAILPTALDWVGWDAAGIADTDDDFREYVRDLTHARLHRPLLLLLGMLGPHLRQQSDEVDREVLPGLLAIALRAVDAASRAKDLETARQLSGIVFSALHFNPDYSLHRARGRRTPYEFGSYRAWFARCAHRLRAVHRIDPAPILRGAVARFPSLLGLRGEALPLWLRFADKASDYPQRSGQDLLELLAQHVERSPSFALERCPTVWQLLSGEVHPALDEFLRRRDHRIPRFQRAFLERIRDALVSGELFDEVSDE